MTRRTTRVTIELVCLLCSREIGVLESDAWPPYGTVLLRQTGVANRPIADWRRLRCATCGGAAMPDEITHRIVRIEAPIDWLAERPRRGRPPARLVEQRRAADPAV
jgi:hypothetical protein